MVVGTAGVSSFQLTLSFRQADGGDQIAFKQDGGRFETSTRTLKFCSDTKYRIVLKTAPAIEFHSLHVAGSDLELRCDRPQSGEYEAVWNTTGINPTRKGDRQNFDIVARGPGGTLKHTLQSKFYAQGNSHADWGHKLDSLIWSCAVDSATGNCKVTQETVQ